MSKTAKSAAPAASPAKYVYRERSGADWQKNQSSYKGFDGDTFLTESYRNKLWKPKEGSNTIRILPPAQSWVNYGHYGVRIKRHTGIGPKMGAYLCHDFDGLDGLVEGREPGKCPICLMNAHARKAHNEELSKQLYAKAACVVWIIDRDNMKEGPKLWIMPSQKMDTEICSRAYNAKRDIAKPVDHPEVGYDIEFDMVKLGGKYPNYSGVELDSDPTPIVEDNSKLMKYLEFVEANPIPASLKYHPTAYIMEVLQGAYDDPSDAGGGKIAGAGEDEGWGAPAAGKPEDEQTYDGPEESGTTIKEASPAKESEEEEEEEAPTPEPKKSTKPKSFGDW